MSDIFGGIAALFLLYYAYKLYFYPWRLAKRENHRFPDAIYLCNLLTGWTIIGWVATLAMAMSGARDE